MTTRSDAKGYRTVINEGLFGNRNEDGLAAVPCVIYWHRGDGVWVNLLTGNVYTDMDHANDDDGSGYVYHYKPEDEGHTELRFDLDGKFLGVFERSDFEITNPIGLPDENHVEHYSGCVESGCEYSTDHCLSIEDIDFTS